MPYDTIPSHAIGALLKKPATGPRFVTDVLGQEKNADRPATV